MGKLLLVDLDGTVRQPISNSKFIERPHDQQLIPGAAKAISHYQDRGWTCMGITNQAGVAAGFKTIENTIAEQYYTLKLLPQLNCIYFCPDFEGRECHWTSKVEGNFRHLKYDFNYRDDLAYLVGTFRKPGAGMLKLAIAECFHKPSQVLMIGDRIEDEQALAAVASRKRPPGLLASVAADIKFIWAKDWWMN